MSVSASSKGASSELSKSKSTPVQVPPPLRGDWEREYEYGGGSRAEKAGVNAAIVHALSGVGSCCVVRAS